MQPFQNLISILILMIFCFQASGQKVKNENEKEKEKYSISECATSSMPDSLMRKQKWYGDNAYLLEVFKKKRI